MIQRIQSLYLAAVFIAMIAFLSLPIWQKVDLGSICTITSYALIAFTDQYILFPYAFSALFACYIALTAAYAIVRHDNRKLQLRLVTGIILALILLLILVFFFIKKTNTAYLINGCSSYQIAIIFPFIALIATLLAAYHIKNDEQLANDDRLR